MSQQLLESVSASNLKSNLPRMDIGDTVVVTFRIVEGDKERTQDFQGVLIARSGRGISEMVTFRKVVDGVGVERIVPINSPLVAGYEVIRHGDARRAKLYYLRDREGKSQRLRDRRRGLKSLQVPETTTANAAKA
jgi:large subunit ribosomal protein L19